MAAWTLPISHLSLESQVEAMRWQGCSAAFMEAWVAGWSLAMTHAIFTTLDRRGIEVDEASRARIESYAYPLVLEG